MFKLVSELTEGELFVAKLEARRERQRLRGFILVSVNAGRNAMEYLSEGEERFNGQFDSTTDAEAPVVYKTLVAAERRARVFEEMDVRERGVRGPDVDDQVKVAFWTHPDYNRLPIDKYLQMTGGRFPGSVTE